MFNVMTLGKCIQFLNIGEYFINTVCLYAYYTASKYEWNIDYSTIELYNMVIIIIHGNNELYMIYGMNNLEYIMPIYTINYIYI